MIPIGTRCILLRAYSWPHRAGTTCVVARHVRGRSAAGNEIECEIVHDDPALAHPGPAVLGGRYWVAQFINLIPIGHDPDTETGTTDREVTA